MIALAPVLSMLASLYLLLLSAAWVLSDLLNPSWFRSTAMIGGAIEGVIVLGVVVMYAITRKSKELHDS